MNKSPSEPTVGLAVQLRLDERSSAGDWASRPRGLCNPIFWGLILLHCLEASQTHTHTHIHHTQHHYGYYHPPSSLFVCATQTVLATVRSLILKKPQRVSFLQLPGNIQSMKCCSLKCQFDIKGSCWETRERGGQNIAFDEQGCCVCSRFNGLWRKRVFGNFISRTETYEVLANCL